MKLQIIATLIFLGISVSSKAQSSIILNQVEEGANLKSDTSSLNPSEKEKWSNKVKPYFNVNSENLKAGQAVISIKKYPQSDFLYGSIDEKMCLLINKSTYVNTEFRIPKSSENIDLKMVYPRRSFVNTKKP